eukprot:325769_1
MEINCQYEELQQISLSNSFSWLNIYLTYLPMFSSKKLNGDEKRIWLVVLILIMNILSNAVHFGLAAKWIFEDWTDNYLAETVYVADEMAILFSRYFSIIYFYKHCNYQWLSPINQIYLNDNERIYCRIDKCIKIIKWWTLLLFITRLIASTGYFVESYLNGFYWTSVVEIIGTIFVYYPIFISIVVMCFIYIKYYAYLLYMTEKITQTENDFAHILSEYKLLFQSFKAEHNFYLMWAIFLYLFGFITDVWISLFDIFQSPKSLFLQIADVVSMFADIFCAVLFVYGACLMNEMFLKFQTLLYESGKQFINHDAMNDNSWNYHSYNYLLHYSSKYPLTIKIGRITITKGNTVKFVVTFAVLRWLSYSAHYFY